MPMGPQNLLLAIFLTVLLPLSAIAANAAEPSAGSWVPIKDVHDRQVLFIANVALNFYNLKHHSNLILKEVSRGATQDSSRFTKYLLHLVADQPSSPCYKTMVLDRKKSPSYREISFFEGEICRV